MKLNSLPSFKKRRKVIGRGIGSGHGKTSTRGHKGQKARSGKKLRPGFEGGQTPIFMRLPKYRGFNNPNHVEYQIVNLESLETLSETEITPELLKEKGLIGKKGSPVKILGDGKLSKALNITADKASKSAIEKITAAGGTFTFSSHE